MLCPTELRVDKFDEIIVQLLFSKKRATVIISPMFFATPKVLSSSIAVHVSVNGTRSNSIAGCAIVGSKTQLGGYLTSNGTNLMDIGKWTRYRSKY